MSIEIRKLNPDSDESLIREALSWTDAQPLFYRNCDSAWGVDDLDKYLEMMRRDPQIDLGVFDGGLTAIITIALAGKDMYNSHLMVKRGANVETIKAAAASIINDLYAQGMKEGWSYLAEKNYGARKILEAIGMKRDGVERIYGASHGKPIRWLRYSV